MEKLLLIDGSNLLFQMFFGMPARIVNQSGKAVHGTMGFLGALLKIIRMTNPTHIAVLFDGERGNERTALNADYKANRVDYGQVPEDECPFTQLPDIYKALDFLKIPHAETSVCETDDWIAGYALTYGKEMKIVISSFDSDYFQLLSENVSILRYRGVKTAICTPKTLWERYGIHPSQYADFKSLVGDSADNIKGAYGVGPKTAACLLQEFSTLENLLNCAERIQRPAVKTAIFEEQERLKTNYRIIKLSAGAELPFPLEKLQYTEILCGTGEVLRGIGLLP